MKISMTIADYNKLPSFMRRMQNGVCLVKSLGQWAEVEFIKQ